MKTGNRAKSYIRATEDFVNSTEPEYLAGV